MIQLNAAIVSAIISGSFVAMGTWFAHRSKSKIIEEEGVAKRLSNQLQGWQDFCDSLLKRIGQLEQRITECEEDRAQLWQALRDAGIKTGPPRPIQRE